MRSQWHDIMHWICTPARQVSALGREMGMKSMPNWAAADIWLLLGRVIILYWSDAVYQAHWASPMLNNSWQTHTGLLFVVLFCFVLFFSVLVIYIYLLGPFGLWCYLTPMFLYLVFAWANIICYKLGIEITHYHCVGGGHKILYIEVFLLIDTWLFRSIISCWLVSFFLK